MTDVIENLESIDGVIARKDELLSMHTTFGVGGPCDLMLWVSNRVALRQVLQIARSHSIPVTLLGRGSNVLVKDGGIDGVVIRLAGEFAAIEIKENRIRAGGGTGLAEVVSKATSSGIGGLDFLAGIPGTVGGAVITNAGSGDTWLSHRTLQVSLLTDDLREVELEEGDMGFGYRTSGIGADLVVLEVLLAGSLSSVEEARRGVEEHLSRRRTTQPAGESTAGCVFKNPPGNAAGRMIDEIGMKGFNIGGARISTVHANWIVNTGGATAGEIISLIEEIRRRVREHYGTDLELEIRVLGRD
ncbi:MAG: UDP-N-acetylmuramate dehydrogenase [bacterium]